MKLKPELTVTSKDHGLAKLRKKFLELSGKSVDVGIFETSGQDVVDRARFNELGTVNIPARPFLGTAFEVYGAEIANFMEGALKAVVENKMTTDRALSLIGMQGQAIVRRRIIEIDSPPNAPSTIARKGSSNPLVETGEMVREVDYRVR